MTKQTDNLMMRILVIHFPKYLLTLIEKKKKNSLRTGFEPVRVTPSDFESDALTTRPSQLD
jgi:hypothetical protein